MRDDLPRRGFWKSSAHTLRDILSDANRISVLPPPTLSASARAPSPYLSSYAAAPTWTATGAWQREESRGRPRTSLTPAGSILLIGVETHIILLRLLFLLMLSLPTTRSHVHTSRPDTPILEPLPGRAPSSIATATLPSPASLPAFSSDRPSCPHVGHAGQIVKAGYWERTARHA